jgi:hypothetical protein
VSRGRAVTMLRGLGRRLVREDAVRLNPSAAPVGMLDVERITRVAAPVSTVTTRPLSTAFTSISISSRG